MADAAGLEGLPRPVVVGGGLAGVTAALYLAERGLRPVLLEAHGERLGGRWVGDTPGEEATLRSGERTWRFPAEHGIHGLWGQYHNLRTTLRRFAGEQTLESLVPADRQEWIWAATGAQRARRVELGRVVTHTLVPAPFHYLALFARPSFWLAMTPREVAGLVRVFASLQLALAFDPLIQSGDAARLARASLSTFFFGWPPRLRTMVAALGRSGLFAEPDAVPLGGFLAFLRFYTLLRRDAQRFHFLPADPERVVFGPVREALIARGAEVRLGARAEEVRQVEPGCWRVAWAGRSGQRWTDPGPLVVAADAPAARALLLQSAETREAAGAEMDWPAGLPSVVARFWWDREPAGRYAEAAIFGGDFTADNVFWLQRIQRDTPFAAWAAETGGSACEVHVYGPDAVLSESDAAILDRVADDLRRAYPDLGEARLLLGTLRRNPATHTLFGADARGLAVETPWPGLWLCGDWVSYPSPTLFLERATVTGMAAANGVLAGFGLEPWPIEPVQPAELLARALGAAWRLGWRA